MQVLQIMYANRGQPSYPPPGHGTQPPYHASGQHFHPPFLSSSPVNYFQGASGGGGPEDVSGSGVYEWSTGDSQ